MANEGLATCITQECFSCGCFSCSAQLGSSAAHKIAAGQWKAAITPARTHKPPCQEHISSLTWVLMSRSEKWACPLPAVWRVSVHKRVC